SDIAQYSSFLKVPIGLSLALGPLYLGVQYSNTFVSTYDRPGYGLSSIEPFLGLRLEPGDFSFALGGSYPFFDPLLPPAVTFDAGVSF
ncbi:MAG TPA: hypothetical protein DD435_13155, partial [Cyanobacteria bacterium UBA8530]|nr:hypothetical protein [Cyanobacteria bacterium UBA8530]